MDAVRLAAGRSARRLDDHSSGQVQARLDPVEVHPLGIRMQALTSGNLEQACGAHSAADAHRHHAELRATTLALDHERPWELYHKISASPVDMISTV